MATEHLPLLTAAVAGTHLHHLPSRDTPIQVRTAVVHLHQIRMLPRPRTLMLGVDLLTVVMQGDMQGMEDRVVAIVEEGAEDIERTEGCRGSEKSAVDRTAREVKVKQQSCRSSKDV